MRKSILYLVLLAFSFSCQDTVEFNNPAVQANFEGQTWKGVVQTAAIKDGGLIIEGGLGAQSLFLFTTRTDPGIYELGNNNQSEARFIDTDGTMYSTLNTPDPTVQVYPSDGNIEIISIDLVSNVVTGTFWFNAFTADGLESVNFIDGNFFEVPIRNNIPEETGGTTCESATTTAMELQAQLDANGPIMPEYGELCTALGEALAIQILACGDVDGTLQQTIDGLDCNDDDNDGVPNAFEDLDMDGNYDNDDTDMDGTPNYLDDDDDGDGILTMDELRDEMGALVDSDGDGNFNYVDNDDDGDGVLTQDEAQNADSTPADTDGDGTVDYLDNDDDGDTILTELETGDTDGDTIPNYLDNDDDGDGLLTQFEGGDTDLDTIPNYLDNDDDGDGILTINENADPNADGNPDDAVDTDMDGTPDYLQA